MKVIPCMTYCRAPRERGTVAIGEIAPTKCRGYSIRLPIRRADGSAVDCTLALAGPRPRRFFFQLAKADHSDLAKRHATLGLLNTCGLYAQLAFASPIYQFVRRAASWSRLLAQHSQRYYVEEYAPYRRSLVLDPADRGESRRRVACEARSRKRLRPYGDFALPSPRSTPDSRPTNRVRPRSRINSCVSRACQEACGGFGP
jgi:hypothetical protein